jgi:hypothetical protein
VLPQNIGHSPRRSRESSKKQFTVVVCRQGALIGGPGNHSQGGGQLIPCLGGVPVTNPMERAVETDQRMIAGKPHRV